MNMDQVKKSNITKVAIVGGIVVAAILVLGTLWMGRSASTDTEQAVRNVSLLYLEELAGRREQVVAGTIDDYIENIKIDLSLMDKDDLSSEDNMHKFQSKMQQMYNLEKFAFVDSTGLIYTSQGVRTDIDQYGFDYNTISEPVIYIKNMNSNNKKVIIAVPVDNLPYLDKTLVACFIEIDMNSMFEDIAMKNNDTSRTTFFNIYSKDGVPLSNMVLGGITDDDNLFEALSKAKIESDNTIDDVKKNFNDGTKGYVSLDYEGIKITLYYMPVEGTDWMLTYMIRESLINEQISSISNSIIVKSVILSIVAAAILVAMFVFMIIQIRRASKVALEKEVADMENKLKQQELEEQLATQEELLEQEKKRAEQDKMITALASDYKSVYYVDLDVDEGMCYRGGRVLNDSMKEGDRFPFYEQFVEYGNNYVDESYREGFLEFIEPGAIRKKLESEPVLTYRYLVHRNDKDRYEMLRIAGVRHIEDREDNIVHAVGVGFTDIDAEMRESLEKNEALSDALNVAEEASKAKTRFLSSMSHEIRTPMNAIIGLDSLALSDNEISDKTREYLTKIDGSARHLLGLINDILDMSRIESGRLVINSEEFDFSKLLEQVNTIIGGQCQEKGLTYDCKINGDIDHYYIGDDMKLRQILINILGNAVKFTKEGGNVGLTVTKTAEYDNKSTFQFVMKDNGIGMSKEYLPKIFDTFSQEDFKAANKYGSSGLGMSITKNIVEMMNGKIEVESEKGVGTTFTVTITLMESDRKSIVDDEDIEITPSEMSVLVVDDDNIAVEHAKIVLEKVGISADGAASGAEALEMVKVHHARREPYNLIIVDWQMPEMDGVETAKRMRDEIGDESAIIILTAYNWDDVFEEAIKAGVDSFVSKPLFSGNVLDEFKNALKKKKVAAMEGNKVDLNGKRILLAEDMEINAEIMKEVLSSKGMEVEHAEDGEITVNMFASNPVGYYDAILMDMKMPNKDGLEATKDIRVMDRDDAKNIPIIALTANAFDEDVQRSLQAGLNAHLSKPVDPDMLFETLEKLIQPDK